MKLYFRPGVVTTGVFLAVLTGSFSFWQWGRYVRKAELTRTIDERLALPVTPLADLVNSPPGDIAYRRVAVSGRFDYSGEVTLRNRRAEGRAGQFLVTPLAPDGVPPPGARDGGPPGDKPERRERLVLINRGFVPLADGLRVDQGAYRGEAAASFVGLVREGAVRRPFSPRDPPSGGDNPTVARWLRVDIGGIAAQLPYDLYPFYVERLGDPAPSEIKKKLFKFGSDKDEILSLASRRVSPGGRPDVAYPLPVVDTLVPADRHFEYVVEWALMGVVSSLVCVVLCLRSPAGPGRVSET